jgi:DmsE family decaheme c-type cytochrome
MMHRFIAFMLLGAALVVGWHPASAQTQLSQTQASQTQAPVSPQSAVIQAGVKTCLACHGGDPKVTAVLHSSMAMMGDPRTPFAQDGCQGCHGDSAAHAAGKAPYPAIVFAGPHASPVEVRNKVCLTCHESGERINWQGSTHERNDIACTNCHTAHAAKDPVTVKMDEPEKCFTCHAQQRAESFMYSHHPIREGKVVCSSCHNPHGAPGDTKLLREFTVNETCYTCHADKRGPLLWEHQPVRENCLNCHNPHGSNQPRLMVEQSNFLCSSCHSAQTNNSGGAFGGAHSIPFRGPGNSSFNSALANQRTCLNCHSQVHGSNSPAGAFFFR